jgi:hypothetical protein
MKAYQTAVAELLQALAQVLEHSGGGDAVDAALTEEEYEAMMSAHDPEYSPAANFLLDEMSVALGDQIMYLSGELSPMVPLIVEQIKALKEPALDAVLQALSVALPVIAQLARASYTYVLAYEELEDEEVPEADEFLEKLLDESEEALVTRFIEFEESLLEAQELAEAEGDNPAPDGRTLH